MVRSVTVRGREKYVGGGEGRGLMVDSIRIQFGSAIESLSSQPNNRIDESNSLRQIRSMSTVMIS